MNHQGFNQRVELPELLVCRFHLLQLLLEPLQHNAPLVRLQHNCKGCELYGTTSIITKDKTLNCQKSNHETAAQFMPESSTKSLCFSIKTEKCSEEHDRAFTAELTTSDSFILMVILLTASVALLIIFKKPAPLRA